jgi:hypothetical protein
MTMQYDILIIQAAYSVRIAYLPHDLFFAEIHTSYSAVNSIISLSPLPQVSSSPPFLRLHLTCFLHLPHYLSLPPFRSEGKSFKLGQIVKNRV